MLLYTANLSKEQYCHPLTLVISFLPIAYVIETPHAAGACA